LLKSVLIANRGEIALRVIRTARRLGMRTIAIYSEADRGAMPVLAADVAVEIGPAPSNESYLRQDRIIEAARGTGAECIHPGCGFLAENAEFAERCAAAGIVFVGPSPEAIRVMGLKDQAKDLAATLGIPTVPGYNGAAQDDETFAAEAARIGFPVLLKAVAGGGGKGLKAVRDAKDLVEIAASARREALAAFGDGRLMIEKLIDPARHIEVQVFADTLGNAVHLFERECTLQRRNQKVIEEAPAIEMPAGLRARMTEAALAATRAAHYTGAGTVEFILPGESLRDDTPFYFMEMNTRLQIEHPVTELITGLDLVEWQFRIAAGEPLPLTQEAISLSGAAVEVRLYAEDPATGFLPSPGRVLKARFPAATGLRIDSGVETGSEVPPHYDAMIAKLIGHGADRDEAYDRLLEGLHQTVLAGPATNLAFLHRLAGRAKAEGAALSTGYIEANLAELTQEAPDPVAAGFGALALLEEQQKRLAKRRAQQSSDIHSPWDCNDGFEFGGTRTVSYAIEADGAVREVAVAWTPSGARLLEAAADGEAAPELVEAGEVAVIWRTMRQTRVRFAPKRAAGAGGASGRLITAPMPGRLSRLFVREGDRVEAGDRIAVLEAMKMEHILHALSPGAVSRVTFAEGAQLDAGAVIAELDLDGADASD
jgi:3-methylcrotonyl-CoA carboxylase alpha subunit